MNMQKWYAHHDVQWRHSLFNDKWATLLFNGMRAGFYIEAGACDGVSESSTYMLNKHAKWTGLLVEPNPVWHESLTHNRPDDHIFKGVLAADAGVCNFAVCEVEPMLSSIVNMAQFPARNAMLAKCPQITVASQTLTVLLDRAQAPRVIHYMCLDVEGSEREVFAGYDFDQYTILAMSVEGHKCKDLLTAHGYTEVFNPWTDVKHETYWVHEKIHTLDIDAALATRT